MRKSWRYIFIISLLSVITALATGPAVSTDSVSSPHSANSALDTHVALRRAAETLAHGDFELAHEQLNTVTGDLSQHPAAQKLGKLLGSYDTLADKLQKARQKAYQKYLDKTTQAVQEARWYEKLLQASQAYDFTSKEKQKQEDKFKKQIQKKWFLALGKIAAAHSLAQRVNVPETLDPNLKQQIITQATETAYEMARQSEWLEAYSRYRNLYLLEEENKDYEDKSQRFWRQAVLADMYVPDPNQDAVSWQQRREGISFNIFALALQNLVQDYVDQADFREMADKAIQYCLLLAETEKINQTFAQLKNAELLDAYRQGLQKLSATVAETPAENFGYIKLLSHLRDIQQINLNTINLPDEVIIGEFAEGAFAALDGYTYIIWPGDVENFRKDMTQEFSGVGILISKENAYIKVDSLLDDSPAERAGLDAGDLIVTIDGKNTTNMTLEMAVRRITGPAGTDVILGINLEDFDQPRDFTVTRGRIVVQTVKGLYRDREGKWQYFIDKENSIAYVHLKNFSGETGPRLRMILRNLSRQGMNGLILDLRDNSGGYLSTAVEIVDTFISQGPIVSTRGRNPDDEYVKSATAQTTFDLDLPLVVLVNSISASASEIVSGSLQDHNRALIVGSRTYGKGNVQTVGQLRPSDAEMKMTIAYYYLPSNRRVHHDLKDKTDKDYGVQPDVIVELTGDQIQQMRKVRRAAETLHRNDQPESAQTWKVFSPQDILAEDAQLSVALLCLQADLLAQSFDSHQTGQFADSRSEKIISNPAQLK